VLCSWSIRVTLKIEQARIEQGDYRNSVAYTTTHPQVHNYYIPTPEAFVTVNLV